MTNYMEILMQRGCINDWLGIDGKAEVDMTEEEKLAYFKEICNKLPTLDKYGWFNRFLQYVAESYGEYDCDDEPCECCGDVTETHTLRL